MLLFHHWFCFWLTLSTISYFCSSNLTLFIHIFFGYVWRTSQSFHFILFSSCTHFSSSSYLIVLIGIFFPLPCLLILHERFIVFYSFLCRFFSQNFIVNFNFVLLISNQVPRPSPIRKIFSNFSSSHLSRSNFKRS